MTFFTFGSSRLGDTPTKWLVAVAAAATGTGLRYLLGIELPGGYPFIAYVPLVIVTGLAAGLWPAVAAAMLSMLGSKLLFADALGGAVLPGGYGFVALLLILGGGAGIWLVYSLNALAAGLSAERERNHVLAAAGDASAAEARRNEARLDAVLQELPIGIVQTDFAGRIEMANSHAARLLGRPLPELNGHTVAEMVHIADRADLAVFFEGLSDGDRTRELRLRATSAGRPALLVHGGLARDTGLDRHSLLLAIERTS
jgi:PAS domain S-box-containing protein